jgi:glycosyltransferase involved in cell wall biosynthesis
MTLGPRPLVSVVVPVLDQRDEVLAFLDALGDGEWEVVIADGGSRDGTAAAARAHRVAPKVGRVPRGRVRQLEAGAEATTGEVIVFASVTNILPPDTYRRVADALSDPAARCGIAGDAAIWLRRAEWAAAGGFPALPEERGSDLLGRVLRVLDQARRVASRRVIRYGLATHSAVDRLLRAYANIR